MEQVGRRGRVDAVTVDGRLLVSLATIAVLLVYAASTFARTLPLISPDELGFISQAQLLAGLPPINMGTEPYYHFGYSLLLVPVWWVTQDPLLAYKGFMLINAVLAALLVPLLVGIGAAFGFRRSPVIILAAAIVALWPSSFFVSHYAWSDALFRLVFALNTWALVRLARRPRDGWALLFAASAAALYAIHPKALLILVLAPAVLILLRIVRAIDTRTAIAALALLVILTVIEMLAMDYLHGAIWNEGGYSVGETLLGRLLRPGALFTALVVVLGQLWYQLAASVGLAALGAWFVARRMLAPKEPALRLAAGYILAAVLAVALASVIQMLDPLRVDHIAYGRYIDGASVVPVWLGLCWLVFGTREDGQRAVGLVAVAVILAAGALLAALPLMASLEAAHADNVAGVGWIFRNGSTPLQFFWVASLLLAIPAIALLLARRVGQMAVLGVIVAISAAVIYWHSAQHAELQLQYLGADAAVVRSQGAAPLYWTGEVRDGSLWSYHLQYALSASFIDAEGALPTGAGLISLEPAADGFGCAARLHNGLFLLATQPRAGAGC